MTQHGLYESALPDGWEGGLPVTKYWNGDYIHLYRVTRPCMTCNAEISLDVSRKALQGTAKNAGLLLRNCPTCRAERKNGGAGSRGGTSRPVSTPAAAPEPVDETLKMANKVMKEELDGLYVRVKDLHAELEITKARLATYELAPAMAKQQRVTAWTPEPTMKTPDPEGDKLMHEFMAKQKNKLPWEG